MTCKRYLLLFVPHRASFQQFLRRPDHKQDFVSQWQADFNSLPEDLWDDEETKAELHQRVNVRESGASRPGSPHSQPLIHSLFTFMNMWGWRGKLFENLPFRSGCGKAHCKGDIWANSVQKWLSEPCRYLGEECISHRTEEETCCLKNSKETGMVGAQ